MRVLYMYCTCCCRFSTSDSDADTDRTESLLLILILNLSANHPDTTQEETRQDTNLDQLDLTISINTQHDPRHSHVIDTKSLRHASVSSFGVASLPAQPQALPCLCPCPWTHHANPDTSSLPHKAPRCSIRDLQ
ncbi:hypothetical protein BDDG_12156 [Blastomyces dermatitidis ATCC 18188]|uniref:Uncharacterized protein n=1 Tax=Ajellomyces dermatitidis (strain ATCC 18188 / CBS 674.68) TaxID=653446 RepID=A0A0J9EN70_AJEDA|nr:hypothetical protein BDDG_12156 [Blastomyces dermatitidis ATCC 18188]